MTSGDVQLFLVPALSLEARTTLERSVSSRVKADLSSLLTQDQYNAAVAADCNLYAWPLSDGADELRTWDAIRRGDYLAFYDSAAYLYIAAVKYKVRNADLGSAIWGEIGNAKDLIVFLETPTSVNLSLDRFSDFLEPGEKTSQTSEATVTKIRKFLYDRSRFPFRSLLFNLRRSRKLPHFANESEFGLE